MKSEMSNFVQAAERFCQPMQATILIVDDDTSMRWIIQRMLVQLGFEVETACDGWEAVELVKGRRYCIIFMDLKMPKMDGYEAARTIRQIELSEGFAEVPIVAVSSEPDE